MKISWNGRLPLRRYAMFNNAIRGDYAIVITGRDIGYAEKWGGFVKWIGGIRPAETRNLKKLNN